MVIGNLATATRVAILVPGSDTTLATFFSRGSSSPGGGAEALAAEAHRLDPGERLAIIAWLGYPTPATFSPAVMTSGDAGQGAQALRPLLTALAQVSFGIAQCGLALLLRDRLARLMRRPLARAGIALVNLSAMTLFLWHQTRVRRASSGCRFGKSRPNSFDCYQIKWLLI